MEKPECGLDIHQKNTQILSGCLDRINYRRYTLSFISGLGDIGTRSLLSHLRVVHKLSKETEDTGRNIGENGQNEEVISCEELMLKYVMKLMHWKRWDGGKWVKSSRVLLVLIRKAL